MEAEPREDKRKRAVDTQSYKQRFESNSRAYPLSNQRQLSSERSTSEHLETTLKRFRQALRENLPSRHDRKCAPSSGCSKAQEFWHELSTNHPRFLGKVESVSRKSCHPPIATGLRIGEAVAIKWSDFDGDLLQVSRRLYEGKVDAPKTRSPERGLPIPHALLSRLRALSDSEWIFRARNGAPVDLSRLWQLQRRNRGSFEPSGRDRPREATPSETLMP